MLTLLHNSGRNCSISPNPRQRGPNCEEIDIKSAYRLVPVYGYDRQWLGMKWQDKINVDGMLPFGLRSAPKVFNTLADSLEWIVHHEAVEWIFHYLDDFVVIGPPGTLQCQRALDTLIRVYKQLGVPLAPEKQDGPTTSIVVLGILIDTIKQELRVLPEKLDRLLSMVEQWGKIKACTRQELEFLIGTLHHACKVIRPGRSFLRRLIALLRRCRKKETPSHPPEQRVPIRHHMVENSCMQLEWLCTHNSQCKQGV